MAPFDAGPSTGVTASPRQVRPSTRSCTVPECRGSRAQDSSMIGISRAAGPLIG
jgi:hypothetical protein